jgi:LmbE family N-acetylglucosaminyl deacetylase
MTSISGLDDNTRQQVWQDVVQIADMEWVYLSPHLDDIALSCGGLVWEQCQAGDRVSVWTVCAGDPGEEPLSPFAQSLHERWQTGREAVRQRRAEDEAACAILGAAARHFPIPDCIYRRSPLNGNHLYTTEESLFGPLHPQEFGLVQSLSAELRRSLPAEAEIVCPLTLGGHVDHRLTCAAAAGLERPLWYYADYPYEREAIGELAVLEQAGWKSFLFRVSTGGLAAWTHSVAAHASQISTFWPNLVTMQAALRDYWAENEGVRLWRPA